MCCSEVKTPGAMSERAPWGLCPSPGVSASFGGLLMPTAGGVPGRHGETTHGLSALKLCSRVPDCTQSTQAAALHCCNTFLSCRGKEGTSNCCFSISAQRYFILVLLLQMSLVRQEKWETALRADFPYFTPFLFSLLPPQFPLHRR